MVGRLAEQKAPDVFVKAAKRIKEIIPKAFFLIVGDGPDWDEVQQEVEDNKLTDSFILAGWTRRPMEYIKILDIAVLISRWEGFGLVLPDICWQISRLWRLMWMQFLLSYKIM